MDTLFPFGYPAATAFYLVLYVLTLMIHVVFMNYVLAGSTYLAFAAIRGKRSEPRDRLTLSAMLKDWMPFALGAAITAGVAPLLFVQILYKKHFYTANLLLSHRWMIMLPILIAGFYLLYAQKTRRVANGPWLMRLGVAWGAFACFGFAAYSWTSNHLLSTASWMWADHYESGTSAMDEAELWVRLAMWFIGSFPTMTLMVCWQLRWAQEHGLELRDRLPRRATWIAMISLPASAFCALLYTQFATAGLWNAVTGPFARPYLILAAFGGVLQFVAWFLQRRLMRFSKGCLMAATVGLLSTLLGAAVIRETTRLSLIANEIPSRDHSQAASVGGFAVFVTFFILNAFLIGLTIAIIRRRLRANGEVLERKS